VTHGGPTGRHNVYTTSGGFSRTRVDANFAKPRDFKLGN
jgi:hypothetical protein